MASTIPFGILDKLLVEVRCMVYQHVFGNPLILIVDDGDSDLRAYYKYRAYSSLSLTMTNRILRQESLPSFLKDTKIHLVET